MALVRVLLFAALAAIAVALLLYALKRDRRYLRFVAQVAKFTIVGLLAILVAFAVARIFGLPFGAGSAPGPNSTSPRTSLPPFERALERTVGQTVRQLEQRRDRIRICMI